MAIFSIEGPAKSGVVVLDLIEVVDVGLVHNEVVRASFSRATSCATSDGIFMTV